jgi:tight adherence protein C
MLLFAGIMGESGVAVVGFAVVLCVAAAANFFGAMKRKLQKRGEECIIELPNMISKLALLTGSGMILREAWFFIANSKDGTIYDLMKQTCTDMENGASDIDGIRKFGMLSNVPEIKKFSSALIQSIEKGSADLISFLAIQSTEMWDHKKQIMLQKGEMAASKLVAPIALMFAGILIIILTAAMAGMSL